MNFLNELRQFKKQTELFSSENCPNHRSNSPIEKLDKMFAHSGYCNYCNGNYIKMFRDVRTGILSPNDCVCFLCGQKYFMEIEDLEQFDTEQWIQKIETQNRIL